jgi:hypothetical protein
MLPSGRRWCARRGYNRSEWNVWRSISGYRQASRIDEETRRFLQYPSGRAVSTVTIEFRSLYTYAAPQTNVRLPLSALSTGAHHVHGELVICLGGKPLPYLGYFGADDACFNTWLQELLSVEQALSAAEYATYVFDEGEQGQPAFEFSREAELLFTSVIASAVSDGEADPSYQRVCCLWIDFKAELSAFKEALRVAIRMEAGPYAEVWWSQNARSAA